MSLTPAVRPAAMRPEPTPEERAILRTVLYAGLFQYPLTLEHLGAALMDVRLEAADIQRWLRGPFLRERLEAKDGLVHPKGRGAWLTLRRRRRDRSRALLDAHDRLLRTICSFPFVRLVALSGACAHENAVDDDVDVFLIVKRDRAWTVGLALMILCKILGKRRTLCLNYILDEEALALPETDLFTASEVRSLRPLAGAAGYLAFVAANPWLAPMYPNFHASHTRNAEDIPAAGAPPWVEALLDRTVAPILERCSRLVLGTHLRRKWGSRHPGVRLSLHRLKLHAVDHGPRLRAAFAEALEQSGYDDD